MGGGGEEKTIEGKFVWHPVRLMGIREDGQGIGTVFPRGGVDTTFTRGGMDTPLTRVKAKKTILISRMNQRLAEIDSRGK